MISVALFFVFFFFFNDTATTEIYTLSLHDALPIWRDDCGRRAFALFPLQPFAQGGGHHPNSLLPNWLALAHRSRQQMDTLNQEIGRAHV